MEQHRRKQHSLMMLVRLRSPLCALSDPILSGVVVVVGWCGWWCGWWWWWWFVKGFSQSYNSCRRSGGRHRRLKRNY